MQCRGDGDASYGGAEAKEAGADAAGTKESGGQTRGSFVRSFVARLVRLFGHPSVPPPIVDAAVARPPIPPLFASPLLPHLLARSLA